MYQRGLNGRFSKCQPSPEPTTIGSEEPSQIINRKRAAVDQPKPSGTKMMKLNTDPPFDRYDMSFLNDLV